MTVTVMDVEPLSLQPARYLWTLESIKASIVDFWRSRYQAIDNRAINFLNTEYVRTTWIGNNGTSLISLLTIQSTDAAILLQIRIPNLFRVEDLEILVTSASATIQGSQKKVEIEDYLGADHFHNVITFPVSVFPEKVQVNLVGDMLTLTLPKHYSV
jgi:HSP20 family molecular chaperone IbpA